MPSSNQPQLLPSLRRGQLAGGETVPAQDQLSRGFMTMRVSNINADAITVTEIGAPGLVADGELDSVQLLACSIASCTWTTLSTYGMRFDADAADAAITVRWTMADKPKRVGAMSLDVSWPSLPDSRLDAATRAARHCTIHATLAHGVEVDTFVDH